MGFKTDSSFLRFLSMGAIGTRRAMEELTELGFRPIELERYCTTNKIWTTKVKRLRLPDVLCVRTGVRFEIRAKSDLKIRMSDAPDNPDRRWDTGLRDDDVVVTIVVRETDGVSTPARNGVFFTVRDLRTSVAQSKLGPPKSASEGAERDREWPSIVPSDAGEILEIDDVRLVVRMASGRRQTYQLRGKHPYLGVGQRFVAETAIIAGAPPRQTDIPALL